jgi:hypothetical protein
VVVEAVMTEEEDKEDTTVKDNTDEVDTLMRETLQVWSSTRSRTNSGLARKVSTA